MAGSGTVARSRFRPKRPVTWRLDDPSEPNCTSVHPTAGDRSILVRQVVAERPARHPRARPRLGGLGREWRLASEARSLIRWRGDRGRGGRTDARAVREHHAEQTLLERDAEERRRRGVTFRELAAEYLRWLEDVKGAKPSTLRDHRCLLAEPG